MCYERHDGPESFQEIKGKTELNHPIPFPTKFSVSHGKCIASNDCLYKNSQVDHGLELTPTM